MAVSCPQNVDDRCAELIFGVTKNGVQKIRKNNAVIRVGREVLAFFVPETRKKNTWGNKSPSILFFFICSLSLKYLIKKRLLN